MMRRSNWLPAAFAFVFLALSASTVFGDDGLMITLTNDTSDGILVTVYDRGAAPPQTVISDRAIYGNASIEVSIAADSRGRGHLSWTAISIDRDMRKCGHSDRADLNDGDTVNVHADGDCAG
jgi:hypothetical protein